MPGRTFQHRRIAIPRDDGAYNVPLSQGLFAIIDPQDVDRVTQHTWGVRKKFPNTNYVWTTFRNGGLTKGVALGRFIMNAPLDMQVDHINRNPLDNRRCNLRLANYYQNNANKRTLPTNTGYIGVYQLPSGRYKAQICSTMNGGFRYAALFENPRDAALARDAVAKKLWGDFARLNFPEAV